MGAMSLQVDLLMHAANVPYLFAFMVRDILWLRIFTVVAAACPIATSASATASTIGFGPQTKTLGAAARGNPTSANICASTSRL
jgi:hypothetical protein